MNSQLASGPQPALEAPLSHTCGRDLVSTRDLSTEDVKGLLNLAGLMKARPADFRGALVGRQLAMFFEKPSLRTRLTFEAGMASLGGVSFFVDQTGGRLDARETLSDIAHNLERWVDGIVLRTYEQRTIEGMAKYARIPVINALSGLEHPCQALADYMTLQEKFGDLKGVRLAYVGDGNNVANSLLLTGALLGSTVVMATPVSFEPDAQLLAEAKSVAQYTGASLELVNSPQEAVAGADAVYTDQWTSMGWEHEAEVRAPVFADYQVNERLMAHAARHAVFMHCLPAQRGVEVTDAVMDSPNSVVFDQAENRMHIQKAILLSLLGNGMTRFPVRSAHD